MCVRLLFRKRPPALSSSTGGHWLEELNSSSLLITSLRGCIVPRARRISATNTPVHMHTATGSQASAAPHRPTQPLINRTDYQQGGTVGFVLICLQKSLSPFCETSFQLPPSFSLNMASFKDCRCDISVIPMRILTRCTISWIWWCQRIKCLFLQTRIMCRSDPVVKKTFRLTHQPSKNGFFSLSLSALHSVSISSPPSICLSAFLVVISLYSV